MGPLTRSLRAGVAWLHRLGARARPGLPDLRDLHVYGGGLLVALGVGAWDPRAGAIVFGVLLLGLGLWKGGTA